MAACDEMEREDMPKQVVRHPENRGRSGSFSQVVEANGLVFVAGQVGDAGTGSVVDGGIEAEVRQALANVRRILGWSGLDLSDVVKATVYLVDMADFGAYDRVWREHFPDDPPTRATVAVAGLVPPYRFEVEVIAAR
jgi:2-iminobutanoate/2-iminopropanoate deaminase